MLIQHFTARAVLLLKQNHFGSIQNRAISFLETNGILGIKQHLAWSNADLLMTLGLLRDQVVAASTFVVNDFDISKGAISHNFLSIAQLNCTLVKILVQKLNRHAFGLLNLQLLL
jgi:hypothetical protein